MPFKLGIRFRKIIFSLPEGILGVLAGPGRLPTFKWGMLTF